MHRVYRSRKSGSGSADRKQHWICTPLGAAVEYRHGIVATELFVETGSGNREAFSAAMSDTLFSSASNAAMDHGRVGNHWKVRTGGGEIDWS